MTRALPYLILPLAVLLLQYHGIAFWTTTVTGSWPGWVTWGFLAAWPAWGWSVLLEAVNVWAWAKSRVHGGWQALGLATTLLLCAGALWNTAQPVRVNAQVVEALGAERDRVMVQEDRTQARADRRKGWLGNLMETQDRGVELFQAWMAEVKAGHVQSDAMVTLALGMQLAAVLLAAGAVVLAVREIAGDSELQRASTDYTDYTDDDTATRTTDRAGVRYGALRGRAERMEDKATESARQPTQSPSGGDGLSGRRKEATAPASAAAAETQAPGGVMADPVGEIGAEELAPPEPEPELTARVVAAREGLWKRFPGRKAQEIADAVGVREADLSFLMHHEARAQKKLLDRTTRIVSENALRKMELAAGVVSPTPRPAPGPPPSAPTPAAEPPRRAARVE